MRVGIEKRYIGSYKSVVKDANKLLRKSSKVSKKKYEKALLNKELSVEKKKQQLVKALHQLILHAFSVKQSNKKKALKSVRDHAELIRLVIHKIKDINNYLEESLLKELGIVKKSIVMKAVKAKNPERFLEKQRGLPKSYIKKIEHTVYKLMQEIVFFDERLIRGYGKKEIRIIGKEKVEIKGIEKLLKTETEILDALEAKIPPASKIKEKLFAKGTFNKWVPYVFALLSSFEAEHEKENEIFSKLKKNRGIKNRIGAKIKHIVKEKEKMLKLKEKRALSMEKIRKIGDDYRQVFHEYIHAASL